VAKVSERWAKLKMRIQKKLRIKDPDILDVCMATVLSARTKADPVWLQICGPSSSGKTEILRMFGDCSIILQFTGMTENALISGYVKKDEEGNPIECSLLADLNRKALIIKDMSELMSKPPEQREKLEAILRDAFDGYVKRAFGGEAHYKGFKTKFALLAATTSAHEAVDTARSKAFGQRFIQFNMIGIPDADREEFFEHCLSMAATTDDWREDLRDRLVSFIEWVKDRVPAGLSCQRNKLFPLCDLAARARTPFIRDRFQNNSIVLPPEPEFGIRLGKQIYAIMCLVKWLGGRPKRIARRIAESCIVPRARADIMRKIHQAKRPVKIKEILDGMKVSPTTVRRHLEELKFLDLVHVQDIGSAEGRYQLFSIAKPWRPHADLMFRELPELKENRTVDKLIEAGLDPGFMAILEG